jgi:hypothetical protein
MTGRLLQFPPRGPFAVDVVREDRAWLVVSRGFGWLHGSRHAALSDAAEIARGFGVAVRHLGRHLPTTGDRAMAYDNKNRGALFRCKKERDNDRDYSGTLDIDGVEFWISGWVKTSKAGQKFLALSITAKTGSGDAAKTADAAADELF